MYKMKTET